MAHIQNHSDVSKASAHSSSVLGLRSMQQEVAKWTMKGHSRGKEAQRRDTLPRAHHA